MQAGLEIFSLKFQWNHATNERNKLILVFLRQYKKSQKLHIFNISKMKTFFVSLIIVT